MSQRHGIAHHLIDVADPLEEYSPLGTPEAAATIRDITAQVGFHLVSGTGLYYRALTQDSSRPQSRHGTPPRLDRIADLKVLSGSTVCSAESIRVCRTHSAEDRKRLVRALEVYYLTGRPLTEHFENTQSPLPIRHPGVRPADSFGAHR
jgi:tRNA dimethylallyltransferase